MNTDQFCFIICTNNDLLLEESLHYIRHLAVPEGYSIDLLTIKDAASMTSGYNEAMASTDARFKIYMHQDVFILNKNFLSDILAIFQSDPEIGLIGMTGYETVSPDGIMWNQPRIGSPYSRKHHPPYPALQDYRYSLSDDGYRQVALVDGFLMATSCDYPWNTQELKGFDFYDAWQCITFLSNRRKIVVPIQNHPWCMHDDGQILNLTDYDRYRRLFMHTCKDALGKKYDEITSHYPSFCAQTIY